MKLKYGNGRITKAISVVLVITGILFGGAFALKRAADWGADHQIVGQSVIKQSIKLQFPIRIDQIEKTVIVNPIIEQVVTEEFTTIEQKIVDRWGFKNGIVAIAVFDCGESGLDADAVSITGDLGISQINWPINGQLINEKLGYGPADMFDIDANLDAGYLLWDRGDGVEGNDEGNFNAWVGYNNGAYARCFE